MPRLLRRPAARLAVAVVALTSLAAVPVLVSGASAAHRWVAPAAAYPGVVKEKDVPITMRDGVVLYADVIRPADASGNPVPGRFPVVLTQTPYNKNGGTMAFESDYLVQHGYVQVIVDVRGTGSSGGTWDSFGENEQRDGYELVEWAASPQRPWSNGNVALHGTSYGALNQFLTAEQQPPHLKAMFPIVPMGDAYRDIAVSGGQVNTSFIPLWLGLVSALGLLPPTYSGTNPVGGGTTVASHASSIAGFQASVVASAASGGDQAYDGPFYRLRSPIERISKVTVPTFVVGGWFDLFQRGEPMLYQALRANGVPTRLLMGPWTHLQAAGGSSPYLGNGLPAQGVPTLDELELRWFDHYVKGIPDPTLDKDVAPVTYYENGTGTWRTADAWPAGDVDFRTYQLSGSASPGAPAALTPGTGSGAPDSLAWLPATGPCSRSTVQWTAGVGIGTPCETDNRLNDAYSLGYDLPVTGAPLHLLGPITARLFVSGNGRDGQLTARVEDVAPDGTVTQLTAGWQVLSLRALDESRTVRTKDGVLVQPYHPFTRESVLPPPGAEPVEVAVEIFPTGASILPGHTLRLTLQTGDAPHLTAPVPQAANSAGGVLQIWHDAAHPSQLVLPVRAS
jgi:putative CocE/NonD family hydrolase